LLPPLLLQASWAGLECGFKADDEPPSRPNALGDSGRGLIGASDPWGYDEKSWVFLWVWVDLGAPRDVDELVADSQILRLLFDVFGRVF